MWYSRILSDLQYNGIMRWLCQGVREYSTTLSLEDKLKVDLVIIGSVAVSRAGTLGVAHTHTHASLGSCIHVVVYTGPGLYCAGVWRDVMHTL